LKYDGSAKKDAETLLLSCGVLRKYRFTEGGNAGGDGETGWMAWRFGTI
jgi:hypothetical protein